MISQFSNPLNIMALLVDTDVRVPVIVSPAFFT
nr:MAG TPA: hypothetical protein [Caudoviricetes sp.]